MTTSPPSAVSDENCIAALDIGSNSFHFVLARIVDANLQVLHSEKHQVQLANGLDEMNILSEEAIIRGLQALEHLAIVANQITRENFRVIATYTLRKAKNANAFLTRAADIFPYDIEVVSGHEEARLIYQGVSHYVQPNETRLVVDIGGGSTECIIGKNDKTFTLESLDIGCVSFAKNFFADGKITKKAFDKAIIAASLEIEEVSNRFINIGWQSVLGTSGTIKSIYQLINDDLPLAQPINRKQLHQLKEVLINFSHTDNINLSGLKEERRQIICPGLAILIALVEVFNIDNLSYCDYSLREGVIFGQLSEKLSGDIRDSTIASLQTRFNISTEQVTRVQSVASNLYQQVKNIWKISDNHYYKLLLGAIRLHEIGLDINPSGFHRHGKYIIENADLPGFNQEQIQALAWLVGSHRRKIQNINDYSWFLLKPEKLFALLIILRLACVFNKQRQLANPPEITLAVEHKTITIAFPALWAQENSLIVADIENEQNTAKILNFQLNVFLIESTEENLGEI